MIADRRIKTSLVAIAADVLLTVVKFVLAFFTGSAALLADAYHSATDFIVSLILLVGLLIRGKSEQSKNERRIALARKIESILAILVALIILYVPVELISEINTKQNQEIQYLWLGIAGMLGVIGILFFMTHLKTHVGKETDSVALEADGYHSLVDLFSSFAVLLSLIGFMVGIYIDNMVAILIAAMIGLSGIELLISGFRSLIRGSKFDQLSLLDSAIEFVNSLPIGQSIRRFVGMCVSFVKRYRFAMLAAVCLIYVGTGFKQIPLGYTGIQQVFYKSQDKVLLPGLHFNLPWPFGQTVVLADAEIYSVSIGSSISPELAKQHGLWREIKETRVLSDNANYMVTGDENLVDINFTLQFRLSDATQQYYVIEDVNGLIASFSESALWQQSASSSYAELMQTSHTEFANKLSKQVTADLAAIGINIEVVGAYIQSVQPPALVVSSYRDVFTADQERQQRVNRAIAKRLNDMSKANASVMMEQATVKAQAIETQLSANAEVERIRVLGNIYQSFPAAFMFNRRIDTIGETLANKDLVIIDPAVSNNDIRNWVADGNSQNNRAKK